jgi:leucyl/phenylalanyl-tRNA--protein transferase
MKLVLMDQDHPEFPSPDNALDDPDGLLAVGGNLSPDTLLTAYSQGIFPWFQDDDPILWWNPSTRCIIEPENLYISSRLRRLLRQNRYTVTGDTAFEKVINACAKPRDDGGTWITDEMIEAYIELFHQGYAHCVEVWQQDNLVGGIYGVLIGKIFCGESMFSAVDNGSKIAIAHLCQWMQVSGMQWLDCQLVNPHLTSLGAHSIKRSVFLKELQKTPCIKRGWSFPQQSQWTGALLTNGS